MQNNIATFLNFPAEVTDGRWHIVTLGVGGGIDGQEFEYRAATDGYGESMYRHRSAFGSSNACFSLSGNPENFAAKIGRYLVGASHCSNQKPIDADTARLIGADVRLETHRAA